jgi:hypothetical protein
MSEVLCYENRTPEPPTEEKQEKQMSSETQFKPGDPRTKTGGRRKGSRDRISTALLEAIAEDFEKFGTEAVRITRAEKPAEYLRICASLLPREFEVTTHNSLRELSDDELDVYIAQLRTERATTGSTDERKDKTLN